MPAPSQPMLKRQSSLGYQVNHLARLFAHALRARIEPHGVVPGQFAQLLALYEEDGLTQQEMCARIRVDQSTMAHTLQRMERDGLVRRRVDSADRRRAIIRLTPRARSLQAALARAAQDVNAGATRGFDADEEAACLRLIGRLIANLEDASTLDSAAPS